MSAEHREHAQPGSTESPPPFWRTRFAAGWGVLAGVASWYLWAEHRAHLLGVLPYVLLLACPLMHVFMHHGHGRHGSGHGQHQGSRRVSNTSAAPQGDDTGEQR
jgi:hypothetical protein